MSFEAWCVRAGAAEAPRVRVSQGGRGRVGELKEALSMGHVKACLSYSDVGRVIKWEAVRQAAGITHTVLY